MSNTEKLSGIIRDVLLPCDQKNRYDIYITDSRIAIVCLGKMSRRESDSFRSLSAIPAAFGVPAPIESETQPKPDMAEIKEEINRMPLDDLIRLSKKSCYYTYGEIQQVKLVFGRKPCFKVVSEEYESEFEPNSQQLEEILEWALSVEALKSKLWVAGKWSVLRETFKEHTEK